MHMLMQTRRCFYVLNPYVKHSTKHNVQDGHLMAKLLLAVTKLREVEP